MIYTDACDLDVLTEKLLIDAFALRDAPSWHRLLSVMEAVTQIGSSLKERDSAFAWTDEHLLR